MTGKPKISASFSLLALVALSLGISALGNGWHNIAQAQSSTGFIRGNAPMPMAPSTAAPQYTMAPPVSAPITGNVYQNAANLGQQAGPENVMIILDGSYSMAEHIKGTGDSKMVAAKRAVLDVVRSLSPATKVGLRIYGNNANAFGACRATDVLVPLGDNNRNLIASKMIGIRPTGATPISYTVERSLNEDFRGVSGQRSIILISDGMETCGEDPCNVAVRMQQMGVNVKINVVGFGLQDYEATKQLRCIALATKGKFYSANTAAELANSLNKAMAVATKVQGTILTPTTPVPPAQSAAPASQPAPKPYEEKWLPADVPNPSKKR